MGMTPDDARRAAMLDFAGQGGRDAWREQARDEVRSRFAEEFARDVRYAIRGLRRAPGIHRHRHRHARAQRRRDVVDLFRRQRRIARAASLSAPRPHRGRLREECHAARPRALHGGRVQRPELHHLARGRHVVRRVRGFCGAARRHHRSGRGAGLRASSHSPARASSRYSARVHIWGGSSPRPRTSPAGLTGSS